ncbi:Fic family protein [Candidatus Thiosymbion oneisti]|uniref:Fic family protein n=1 Tax=Candidatus Thiosymbion oneisti TaxID=589554 RepID=UPI000A7E1E2F|nr:Fic family protein [Candidatus Thiosymbion oneisti]
MTSLRLFASATVPVHPSAAWYLADLGEFRGMQTLYTRQSPQRLEVLRAHALIESAISSNRIEGVSVAPERLRELWTVTKPLFRDRDEEEVRGYRDTLTWIHEEAERIPLDEVTIKRLHTMARGEIWDAGHYKEKDADILERYPDGRERVRFRTVPAAETPERMVLLLADWQRCLDEAWVHPLITLAAFNLDFLCIHPFRDGNGRVSRLLWLLQSYRLGYDVGRFVSLERLVEQNKERYYETLERSSKGWHEGENDPWPYINFVLSIMKAAYREFAERVGKIREPRGAKREQVLRGIEQLAARAAGSFTLKELEHTCPGVSRDMVRRVLREQQSAGVVECRGRGPGASWRKRG